MPPAKPFRVIPCAEWGARLPKAPISPAAKPVRIIFHHTAGHAINLDHKPTESYAEAVSYAQAIQRMHMDKNGWNDTGQNFLVTRSGHIFEGRHGSLAAIQSGHMVVSAHCPGQNDQPGIEHEQIDPEPLTPIQHDASVWLHAWICSHTGIHPKEIHGHREYFATACPGTLYSFLPSFRNDVRAALSTPAPPKIFPKPPSPMPGWWWEWADWRRSGRVGPKPVDTPRVIPLWAWGSLIAYNKKHPPNG